MNVLVDCHHRDLFHSLQILFEKRLGFKVYRQIGLEWYQEKFWHVFPHPDTAKQYLGLDQAFSSVKDIHGNELKEIDLLNKEYTVEDGIYYVKDPTIEGNIDRAVTLDKFKEMNFDIVVSSIPQHIQPFNKLIQLYQPKAKHIFQVGNAWGHKGGVKNILASTAHFKTPPGINTCFYHQEFDLNLFNYIEPSVHNEADSYIHYMQELHLLNEYKTRLPDWKFRTHGAGMDDCYTKVEDIANQYKNSGWTWHVKPGGDGFGYGLFRSGATGRPMIIKSNYYKHKLAEELMEDLVTCIDISKRNTEENCKLLQEYSQPEKHIKLCENTYKRFKERVNFDEEEIKIRKFIEDLQ